MRLVIQRVTRASVSIKDEIFSQIGLGFLVLVGFENADTAEDITWAAQKLVNMRVFADSDGKMNLSIREVNGEILLVSQFTLHASTKKGNRPSFIRAAPPDYAKQLFSQTVATCERLLPKKVKTGVFGADMQVTLVNQGPVTIVIDTKNKE